MYDEEITIDTQHASDDDLPPGSVLFHGQYKIDNVITSGGFGITYFATDHVGTSVVIKECFPGTYCRRQHSRVRPRSAGSQKEMSKILKYFLREARSLSSLNHPNVVHVHQVFQEHDTAYMVMDRIRGDDLLNVIEGETITRTPPWIMSLTMKMVTALAYVHGNDILHRDIAPDNIFIDAAHQPVLIDFGAACWISDMGQEAKSALSVVKDGYSPHELYFPGGNIGPWTDIYALGATIYHAITGVPPADSQSRIAARAERTSDPLPALAGTLPGYPPGFLESIDKALRLFPGERYQSAESWLEDLTSLEGHPGMTTAPKTKAATSVRPTRPTKRTKTTLLLAQDTASPVSPTCKGNAMALDITGLNDIAGFIGGCLVDSETGMMMAAVGGGKFDLEAASAANTEVVRAKNRAIQVLGLDDKIEDILITLGKQYHLIRPMEKSPTIFLYVALDKAVANLGMSRVQVKKVEQSLAF